MTWVPGPRSTFGICRTFQKPGFCVEKKRQVQCRPADIQRGRVLGADAVGLEPGSVVLQVQREIAPIAKCFDLIIASRARAAVLLVFVALCALLPGFTAIPPVDRDEPRYAQASKQMMETGNYLDIRFQEQPRYLQPAGIYWLQVTAAKITGYGPEAPIWVYRLPSLLAATAAVVLTYWVALPLAGPVGAFIAALLFTPCILLGVEARLAKTDAVLLACILSATGFLARAYLRQIITLRAAVLFWTACGAGILVKGPMIALVVGTTVVALCVLDRSTTWLKALRPALGLGWLTLLVLPWFIAIAIVSDGEFYRIAIGQSLLGKVAAGQQGHGAPPGVYFLLYWITFWPAAGLALTAFPWVWQNRGEPVVRFCLAWILPTWLVFELISTKLPHYVLPVYSAIAILIALGLLHGRRPDLIIRFVVVASVVFYGAIAFAALYVLQGQIASAVLIVTFVATVIMAFGMRHAPASPAVLAAAVAFSGILMNGVVAAVVAPNLKTIWVAPRLAAAIKRHTQCPQPHVASAGFEEPSLIFLVGTRTQLVDGDGAARFLAEGGCRIALVTTNDEPAFIAELAAVSKQPELLEQIPGMNIGKVRKEDIGVYRLRTP
jgi:4-amino-4-deoxy-L-arabinose transferase-like glycosyltransferase